MSLPRIPVLVVTKASALPELAPGDTVLRLPKNTNHGHTDGTTCIACAAQTDIRALLFNLLIDSERNENPSFTRVIVDASALSDPAPVLLALEGKLPATALRDHTVAKRFYLQAAADH